MCRPAISHHRDGWTYIAFGNVGTSLIPADYEILNRVADKQGMSDAR